MAHRHRVHHEGIDHGCADGVKRRQTCSCGAERTRCTCTQCYAQGTSTGKWLMPTPPTIPEWRQRWNAFRGIKG